MSAAYLSRPAQRPQECCDWLTREEVTRMAMKAFDLASGASFPPAGQRFMQDGMPWSGRDQFAEDLAAVFELQIKAEANRLGIDRGDYVQAVATLQRWTKPASTTLTEGAQ